MARGRDRESREMWCPECKGYRDTTWIDEGIGGYEYWGHQGNHEDWIEVCESCELAANNMLEWEPDEPEEDEGSFAVIEDDLEVEDETSI